MEIHKYETAECLFWQESHFSNNDEIRTFKFEFCFTRWLPALSQGGCFAACSSLCSHSFADIFIFIVKSYGEWWPPPQLTPTKFCRRFAELKEETPQLEVNGLCGEDTTCEPATLWNPGSSSEGSPLILTEKDEDWKRSERKKLYTMILGMKIMQRYGFQLHALSDQCTLLRTWSFSGNTDVFVLRQKEFAWTNLE